MKATQHKTYTIIDTVTTVEQFEELYEYEEIESITFQQLFDNWITVITNKTLIEVFPA